jgi:hypothetical protein
MIHRRSLEAATALLTGAFGVVVVISSISVGSGWSEGGVGSGTFPLIAGVLILGGSLFNLVKGLIGPNPGLLGATELRRLAGLFLPALAFVAAIPLIGLYVASAGYLLWMLTIQHSLAWWRTGIAAAATILTLYFLFEQTFQVPLPRGWLGSILGF